MPLATGTRLGPYEILAAIGSGGMGEVYRARDTKLGREVAIKILAGETASDPGARARFEREARAVAALSHPHIVTIHDIFEAGGTESIVMEFVPGRSLDRIITERGLSVTQAVDLAAQIASALDAAHNAGVIHRDIKPANIMVSDAGQVKVLDFGLAKLFDRGDADAVTITAPLATAAGAVMGTVGYMSPEQAKGSPVDARSDMFSFGAVLYEMLAGRRAFAGDTAVATIANILGGTPAPLTSIRSDVPAGLTRLIEACLQKDRTARPEAGELVAQLSKVRARLAPSTAHLGTILRRPRVAVPAFVIALAIAAGAWWWWSAGARARWARYVALPEIQRLVDRDDYDGAFRLVGEALRVLPDDPQLKQLLLNVSVLTTVTTEPPGADVTLKGYNARDASWYSLGLTPLENVRIPFGLLRVQASKAGFQPVEGSGWGRSIRYRLDPVGSVPPGMVRALGSRYQTRLAREVQLNDYWIDRLEVTNRQFKEFVDRGGYSRREYWRPLFVTNGHPVPWEEAMARFRDATGRPGPAMWELGTYPDAQADFPVSGVSWYEAAAYAEYAGKSLPTLYHWYNAAGFGRFADIETVSNFNRKGPVAAGSQAGLGPYGTYDMAGNVKEWVWNETETGGRRFILGGGWNDFSYAAGDYEARGPFDRQPAFGFRCVKYIEPPPADLTAAVRVDRLGRDARKEKPVGDAIFEVYRRLYRYDPRPLNAAVDAIEETPVWRKETISFDAAYGNERVRAYLFLPKNTPRPFQAVVYFPPGDAFNLRSSRELWLLKLDYIIRSGRALLFPVYMGTYERGPVVGGPNTERDLTISWSKDVGRSLDYLETRADIDRERLGFFGISSGADAGVIVTAVEPRFKASVLQGGGIWIDRPAEIDQLNFASRVRVPTLMVNGRDDFEAPYETAQLPLFRLLGAEHKHHAVLEGAHSPGPMQEVIKAVLGWLDRYLGPVK